MRYPNCVVLIGHDRSQSFVRKTKQGFSCSGGLRQYKQAGYSVRNQGYRLSFQHTEYVRSPCQQMVAKLLLFIKFEPLVNNGEFISADEYFLKVSTLPQLHP